MYGVKIMSTAENKERGKIDFTVLRTISIKGIESAKGAHRGVCKRQ